MGKKYSHMVQALMCHNLIVFILQDTVTENLELFHVAVL
nr:MAG TPA: hypothetical protein [Caudoviricetes sp.]